MRLILAFLSHSYADHGAVPEQMRGTDFLHSKSIEFEIMGIKFQPTGLAGKRLLLLVSSSTFAHETSNSG